MSSNAMKTDYEAIAKEVVAIQFPLSGRPPLLRSSYYTESNPKQWTFLVKEAFNNRGLGAVLVKESSEEGKAILNGTHPKDLTADYLMGLEEDSLKELAKTYKIRVTGKSTQKSIILGILRAVEEGAPTESEQ